MGVVNRFLLMRQVASPARTKATLLGEAVLLTKDRVPLESVIPEGSSEEPQPGACRLEWEPTSSLQEQTQRCGRVRAQTEPPGFAGGLMASSADGYTETQRRAEAWPSLTSTWKL